MEIKKLLEDLENLQKNRTEFFKLVFGKQNIEVEKLIQEIDFLQKVVKNDTLR
jgi:hypothetical protein